MPATIDFEPVTIDFEPEEPKAESKDITARVDPWKMIKSNLAQPDIPELTTKETEDLDKPLLTLPDLTPWQIKAAQKIGIPGAETTAKIMQTEQQKMEGLTSPSNLALGAVAATSPMTGAAIFGIQGIQALPESIRTTGEAFKRGDVAGTITGASDVAMNVAAPLIPALQIAGRMRAPRPPVILPKSMKTVRSLPDGKVETANRSTEEPAPIVRPSTPKPKVSLATKILKARGVADEVASAIAESVGPKLPDETAEEYRARVNEAHDNAGFKVKREVVGGIDEAEKRRVLASQGETPEGIDDAIAKDKDRSRKIDEQNQQILGNRLVRKGKQDASQVSTPTEVHGDVRPQPEQGVRALPEQKGGTGVQPQAEGGLPKEEAQAPVPSQVEPLPTPGTSADEFNAVYGPRLDQKGIDYIASQSGDWNDLPPEGGVNVRARMSGRRVWVEASKREGAFERRGIATMVVDKDGTTILNLGGDEELGPVAQKALVKSLFGKEPAAEGGAETTVAPAVEPPSAGKVEPAAETAPVDAKAADPATTFSESVKDVPIKSKTIAEAKERAAEDQNLGITALPHIGGTGLAKLGNAIKAGLRELRDIPKFTPFKETVNKWFGKNQETSLEVRALQKDIESRVPTESRREAITNYLQADGNPALLDIWARGTRNRKRKAAYDAAKNLTPDEIRVAQAIRQLYDNYLARAQAYDLVDTGIADYVTQVWKRPLLGGSQFAQFASKLSPKFRFGKQRVFENFFEGEQSGFKPVTKDISKLVGLYVSEMGKTIATRDFMKDLTTKDAADGRPLAVPSGVGNVVTDANAQPSIFVRPNAKKQTYNDYSRWTHPSLTGWKWVASDPVSGAPVLMQGSLVLHPDIAGHVENMLSRSAIKRWYDTPSTPLGVLPKALAKGIDQWQGVTKQVMLGFFAPFHHVQEATHAVGHRVNPVFDLPALNHADPALQRAMNHGLAVAGDNAAMENFREGVGANKIFGKIPIVGEWANNWSDFLFHEYIPRLKWKTYQDILHRNLQRYGPEIGRGEATIDDVEYLSSKQTNAAFGHQNYADLGRNPTIQHIARTLALAPDFLEARTRFFGQSLKGLIGKEGREQLLAMATLAGTFWIGARIINKLASGDYHNEEPFGVILNGRLYTMRSVPEDAWRAFGKTMVSKLTTGKGDLEQSRQFVYNRVSPIIGKGVMELLSGRNYRGEKTSATETMQDLLASWIPITLRNLPGVEKLSPSQVNRSVNAWEAFMGAMGVQISRHSPISKAYQIGADYMRSHGIKEDRGSYPVSKYQQLRYALEDSNLEKAAAEIQRLRDTEKMSMLKIHKGFKESLNHPWTKSQAMDRQFKSSLSPENKFLINEVEEQRKRIWQRYIKARAMIQQSRP